MSPTRGEKMIAEANLVRLRTQAAILHEEYPHKSAGEIGRQLGKTRQWVRKWWEKKDALTGVRTGRPRKLTQPVVETIKSTFGGVKKVKRGGYKSKADYPTTIKKIQELHGVEVCRRTVRNGARLAGLVPKRPNTKPLFTVATRQSRLKFAQVINNNINYFFCRHYRVLWHVLGVQRSLKDFLAKSGQHRRPQIFDGSRI